MGAGLPTQRVGGCLLVRQGGGEYLSGVRGDPSFELLEFERRHCLEVVLHRHHSRANSLFELSSFARCHQLEKGLHLLHSRLGRFRRDRLWTIFGVVSFLSASVARSSFVSSVLPWRGVSRLIRRRSDFRQRLAEPG